MFFLLHFLNDMTVTYILHLFYGKNAQFMHMVNITFYIISRLHLPDSVFRNSLDLLGFFLHIEGNRTPTYLKKTIAAKVQTQFPSSPLQPNLLAS